MKLIGTQQLVACTLLLACQGNNHGLANASSSTSSSGQEEAVVKEKTTQQRRQVRHAARRAQKSHSATSLRALLRTGEKDAEPMDYVSESNLDMENEPPSAYSEVSRNEGVSDGAAAFAEALRISPLIRMAARLSTDRIIRRPLPTGGGGNDDDSTVFTVICGDGIVDSIHGEMCDDGNTINGDGCSATCCMEINRIALFPGEMYSIRDDDVLPPNHGNMKLCYNVMCLSLNYLLAPGMDIIGIDVHNGSSGGAAEMQAQFLTPGLVLPVTGAGMFARGAYQSCITVDPDLVHDIATNPVDYYLEIRTVDIPSGAVRGELKYMEYEGVR